MLYKMGLRYNKYFPNRTIMFPAYKIVKCF